LLGGEGLGVREARAVALELDLEARQLLLVGRDLLLGHDPGLFEASLGVAGPALRRRDLDLELGDLGRRLAAAGLADRQRLAEARDLLPVGRERVDVIRGLLGGRVEAGLEL